MKNYQYLFLILLCFICSFKIIGQNYDVKTGVLMSDNTNENVETYYRTNSISSLYKSQNDIIDSLNVEFVDKVLYGQAYSVVIKDSTAFVGTTTALLILNISDPLQPKLLSHIHHRYDYLFRIKISGNYAFLPLMTSVPWGENGAVEIIDISNLLKPVKVSSYKTESGVLGLDIKGNYCYVAAGTSLLILDISNITKPVQVSSLDFGGVPNFTSDVAISGNYAYVAATAAGLKIVDISNPLNPTIAGEYLTNNWNRQVIIKDNKAYLLSSFYPNSDLEIIDIVNPASPAKLGSIPLNNVGRMCLSGSYVFVANQESPSPSGLYGSLSILDISNPSNIKTIGNCAVNGGPFMVDINNNYAYLAAKGGGVVIVDINSISLPQPVTYYNSGFLAYDVKVLGQYLYVADRNPNWPDKGALRIIDISNPNNPTELNSFNTGGECRGISIKFPYIFIADGPNGIRVLNVTDINNITEIGNYSTNDLSVNDVYVSDNYAYAVTFDSLLVFDISNPITLTRVKSIALIGGRQIQKGGNYLFISAIGPEKGMHIVDVTDPTKPTNITTVSSRGSLGTWQTFISGNYAYLADSEGGLRIINITNPNNPVEIGSYVSTSIVTSITVSNNKAYLGVSSNMGSKSGVEVVDITNAANPNKVGFYTCLDYSYDISVSGDYIYLCSGSDGLNVLKYVIPTSVDRNEDFLPKAYVLDQNYPNPFNPITKISYELAMSGFVTLKVYDILGKEVATLINEEKPIGTYEATFKASNLPSGIYFYKLQAGSFIETKKMILIK